MFSLLYIVHLEAVKAGMKGIPRRPSPLKGRVLGWGFTIAGTFILIQLCLWLSAWLPWMFGEAATGLTALLILATYIGCVWYSARWFDQVDPAAEIDPSTMTELPPTMPTVLSGLFYILPYSSWSGASWYWSNHRDWPRSTPAAFLASC